MQLVTDVIDELTTLAEAQGCKFSADFKQKTIEDMTKPQTPESIMWQDYMARRPMEVETFLGSPIRVSQDTGVRVPRIETLYAVLHNLNTINQSRPKSEVATRPAPGSPPPAPSPLPRMSSQQPNGRPMTNGGIPGGMPNGNGVPRPRPRGSSSMGPPPGMRRPPPPMNGGMPNGYGRPSTNGYPGPRQASRRGSMEGADLEEFSHLVVYDDIPEGGEATYQHDQISIRERELDLRHRELALREQEMRMRRGGGGSGPPRRPPPTRGAGMYDDEDEDEDFFDPSAAPGGPSVIDPDNFDMMSVTSRKNRKAAPAPQYRKNSDYGPPRGGGRFRPGMGRNRSSQIVDQVPGVHTNILDDPLMSCSSNRYGTVDRGTMQAESRANSLTASRLDELQFGPGGPPPMGMNGQYPRRSSQSPGNPYSPSIRGGNGRPSPHNGFHGPQPNGRPSPPDGMRQPVPRYPPGHGNAVAPQQVEQHVGVSALQPPMGKNVRSLTGSASASAGSGDSTQLDSEPSAHSSQSSLGPRPPIGVR